jgi:hypothetical protein
MLTILFFHKTTYHHRKRAWKYGKSSMETGSNKYKQTAANAVKNAISPEESDSAVSKKFFWKYETNVYIGRVFYKKVSS